MINWTRVMVITVLFITMCGVSIYSFSEGIDNGFDIIQELCTDEGGFRVDHKVYMCAPQIGGVES